jgi:hypothetical protein
MKKILFVHQGETIAYLIDRVENTKDHDIYINIDANLDLFADVTNLKLLKREISFLGKTITIISKDKDILDFAESLGFNVEDEQSDEREVSHIKEITGDLMDNRKEEENSSTHFLEEHHKEQVIDKINKPEFLQNENNNQEYQSTEQETQGSIENLYESKGDDKNDKVDSFFERSMKERSSDVESSIFKKRDNLKNTSEEKKFNINPKKVFLDNKKITYITAVVLVFLILGSVYIFRSKATLNIAIKKETLDFTFPVTADANISEINITESRIPGQIIKLENEVSGEFKATGASEGATKASGKLTIYNEYGSESQSLVANTRFQTDDGKIFRIQKRVTVPGAKMNGKKVESPGILEVEVLADEPGSEYNIGPANFKIPGFEGTSKYDGFYAKSSKAMEGGSFGEKRAISESDLKKAKENLVNKLKKSRDSFVKSSIPNNLVFLDTGIEEEFGELDSPKEGSAADTFTAKLKVSYNVIAFDQKDINTLTEESLALRLKEERKTYPDTKTISYEDGVFNLDKSSFGFSVRASEVVGGNLNPEELKKDLSGKGEIEIRKILTANDAIETAEITLWPFWSTKAPADSEMIKVIIKE